MHIYIQRNPASPISMNPGAYAPGSPPSFVSLVGVFLSAVIAATAANAFAAPPDEFQKLIESGKVVFSYYDAATLPKFPGHARFNLRVDIAFQYRMAPRKAGGAVQATIEPRLSKYEPQLDHVITLPKTLDRDDRWETPLVRHEFDHVAISTDPRPLMLLEALYRKPFKFSRSTPAVPDGDRASQWVNEEYEVRRKAVQDLIQANYDLLDRTSDHGRKPIPDRETFFRSLYDKPNLDAAKFPFTGEVLDLLMSRAYRQAPLPYRWVE